MEKSRLDSFMQGSVAKAVFMNCIPSMLAMLLVLVYNLADTFFVGQTGDALQVAAISLAMPVFLLFMTVGELFGIGGTSVISRALGRGDAAYAKRACAFCFWGSAFSGLVLSAAILLFMDPLLSLMGASADTWGFAKSYLSITAFAGPFSSVATTFSNVIRAEGQPLRAVIGQAAGNVVNVMLDPLLVLFLGLGATGAAYATLIANVLAASYYALFFIRGKSALSVSPALLRRPRDRAAGKPVVASVLGIGVPAALGSLMMSLSQVVVNMQMSAYGDLPLAAMSVAMKVTMITGIITMGIGQGVQPLVGYCVGAGMATRFKQTLRFSILLAFGFSAAMTAVCYLFVNQIAAAFLMDKEALAYAVGFARILLLTGALIGPFFVMVNSLQAMGSASSSLVVNVSRQGLVFLPATLILNAVMGMDGLILAQPIADLVATVLAAVLLALSWRKFKGSVGCSSAVRE
ncbi:MAG: MATE family efflux transporter [Eggerthellaceae bacterium]